MADPSKKDTDSAFEPVDNIEKFLIGLIAFIQHFLQTLRDLAFNQTRFSRSIKGENTDAKYTKPVTFITLISFLAIRIFRFGVLTFLLFDISSCSAESRTETLDIITIY